MMIYHIVYVCKINQSEYVKNKHTRNKLRSPCSCHLIKTKGTALKTIKGGAQVMSELTEKPKECGDLLNKEDILPTELIRLIVIERVRK